jgi:hypothetical protein
MTAYWDFRSLLEIRIRVINPSSTDNKCVGITQKGKGCTKPIKKADIATASRLLDRMDRSKSFLRSIDDLEELAALLLCKEVHNSAKRPHLSQVEDKYEEWRAVVKEEYKAVKKQRELAETLKMRKDLANVKEDAELDTGKRERVCVLEVKLSTMTNYKYSQALQPKSCNLKQSSRTEATKVETKPSVSAIKTEDPFIDSKGLELRRSSLFGRLSASQAATSTTAIGKEIQPSRHKFDMNISESSFSFGLRQTTFGQAPPLFTKQESAQKGEADKSPTPSPMKTSALKDTFQGASSSVKTATLDSISRGHLAFEFGAKSEQTKQDFVFENRAKVKMMTANSEVTSTLVTEQALAFSGFNYGPQPVTEGAVRPTLLEAPAFPGITENVPVKNSGNLIQEDVQPFEVSPPNNEFGCCVTQKSENEDILPSPCFDISSETKVVEEMEHPERTEHLDIPKPVVPTTAIRDSQALLLEKEPAHAPIKIKRTVTPPPKLEESFGYANITPSSTRYTTYLPAQQLHGLLTPPETPEKIRRSTSPLRDLDYFNTPLPEISFSPSPLKLARKPLPMTKAQEIDVHVEKEYEVELCAACGKARAPGASPCFCGISFGEESRQAGCFSGFGRFGKRMARRTKAIKIRISRSKNAET